MTRLRSWTIIVLVPCTLALAGCGGSVLPQVHSEQERLQIAHRMTKQHKYLEAIDLLKGYIANNGGSADVDDAIYLLGECYVHTREFPSAVVEFERLLTDYPESDSSASASFRLGEAYFGQARGPDFDPEYTLKALTQWQTYLQNYPGHWLNPEARLRVAKTRQNLATKYLNTGNLYYRLKLYEPAAAYYRRITEEYQDTPQAPLAEIGLALIDASRGQRDAAIERLKQIEVAYAGREPAFRAADQRRRIEHAKKKH